MTRKVGRPPASNPRSTKVETLMTQDEVERLEYCCQKTGKSKSDILRAGLEKIYTELRNLEEK